jgi:nicotinamide-nucleotide amidase
MNTALTLFELLSVHGLKLVTAESCTGGMVAAAITDIAGSSAVFDRGFVTYSNAAKIEMLSVPFDLIMQFGAVSENVAVAMAQGALLHSAADISVAVTGIAGPGGASAQKPVGLVHFAVATRDTVIATVKQFGDLSRAKIRQQSVDHAIDQVCAQLSREP